MLRSRLLSATAVLVFAMTASCGGGGSGSGGTPTPTPAPTPVPTPTPTPVAPTARAFGASTGPCYVYLHPTTARDGAPEGVGDCSREGTFGPGAGYLRGYGGGTKHIANYDKSYVLVIGIDSASATVYRYTGPLGSQIYSPLTSLIEGAGSQARVKRAFGLNSGPFALGSDRDLTAFDPAAALASSDTALRQDGARIAASNLRVIATAAALATVHYGDDTPLQNIYYNETIYYSDLGAMLAADDGYLFENSRMTDLLTSLVPAGKYRQDVLSAAAHLIDVYAATIGVQVSDTESAAQFMLGIRGYLEPRLVSLLKANTAAAATEALQANVFLMTEETKIFREHLPFPTTGYFFPTTDFFIGVSGTPLPINTKWTPTANGSILGEDLYWRAAADGGGLGNPELQGIDSISVSAANAARITATLTGDTITVNAVPGFKGTAYFDYRVTHQSGEQGTGRVYVLLR